MKTWKISDAKAHLSEVVASCRQEPQILLSRNKPVAALVGMEDFRRFQESVREAAAPSIASLLDEVQAISQEEEDLDLPIRVSRPVPDLGSEP